MKATIEIPDDLYRRVKAKSALEGRAVREVTEDLFRSYVEERPRTDERESGQEPPRLVDGEPAPPWFGSLRKYAGRPKRHDMDSIRESIARGIVRERKL
ncbi:MAG: hypothetical protein PVG07_03095 [Acidobacteriota bacterium]|jgi:hypothetical protein